MSFACRYPDRVDGCISVDSAPVDESKNMKFREFTYGVLKFMYDLELQRVSKDEAVQRTKEYFKNKP